MVLGLLAGLLCSCAKCDVPDNSPGNPPRLLLAKFNNGPAWLLDTQGELHLNFLYAGFDMVKSPLPSTEAQSLMRNAPTSSYEVPAEVMSDMQDWVRAASREPRPDRRRLYGAFHAAEICVAYVEDAKTSSFVPFILRSIPEVRKPSYGPYAWLLIRWMDQIDREMVKARRMHDELAWPP